VERYLISRHFFVHLFTFYRYVKYCGTIQHIEIGLILIKQVKTCFRRYVSEKSGSSCHKTPYRINNSEL